MARSDFLWQVEAAVLSIESQVRAPSLPEGLAADEQVDCEALGRLIRPARAGDLAEILADSWFAPVSAVLARTAVEATLAAGGEARLRSEISEACQAFVAAGPVGASQERGVAVQLLAVACLQHYSRANFTGPTPPEDESGVLPFHSSAFAESLAKGEEIMEALQSDGEMPYELISCPGYLWLAALLLGILQGGGADSAAAGQALPVWRARAAFSWQLSIAEASERGFAQCPSLFKISVVDLVGSSAADPGPLAGDTLLGAEALAAVQAATAPMLHTWKRARDRPSAEELIKGSAEATSAVFTPPPRISSGPGLAQASPAIRAALMVELANRLCWYNRLKAWDLVNEAACKTLSFEYEVTGVMGIKRQYQTVAFAQLMVKAKSGLREVALPEEPDAETSGKAVPEELSLLGVDDMTDILERPNLDMSIEEEERDQLERPLTGAEQLVLLARCHNIWASSNPNDELILQEVNALAQRVLAKGEVPQGIAEGNEVLGADEGAVGGNILTANWLTFSCGLWYRCKAEHHRNKTRERASFQLQSLVEQFEDKNPSAAHRLRMVHSIGYPARFHLQHEMGTRMMRMGMVSTAHEQFKKLRMWPEAVDCLMVAERNVEATDMVKDLIEQGPTPRLWCCLGDLEKDPKHFEKAWEMSNKRYARAQRSLGSYWFGKKDLAKAVEAYQKALEINPMFPGTWFTMGVGNMQLERWDAAVLAFTRCLAIENDNSQGWANLAAVHMHEERTREARTCMIEACKQSRENWRMWESFLGICMKLRDVQGVIQAMRRLIDLGQVGRVQERVLGMCTAAVINDMDGLFDGKSGGSHLRMLMDFFKFATETTTSRPCLWMFYADLQEASCNHADALESRFKMCRATQARIWDEVDPETFISYLKDFLDCLVCVDEALTNASSEKWTQDQFSPFAYMVRDAQQKLQARLESTVQEPEWKPAVAKLQALASRAEARADGNGKKS
mmetsp:Transcript_44297/g.80262  ORF Transcript_44297/g.80262 Transcript_44297/m.80262 type:complete len:965 (+) Transcript_44297:34-2928(+)